jgi:hypothetical protein
MIEFLFANDVLIYFFQETFWSLFFKVHVKIVKYKIKSNQNNNKIN